MLEALTAGKSLRTWRSGRSGRIRTLKVGSGSGAFFSAPTPATLRMMMITTARMITMRKNCRHLHDDAVLDKQRLLGLPSSSTGHVERHAILRACIMGCPAKQLSSLFMRSLPASGDNPIMPCHCEACG